MYQRSCRASLQGATRGLETKSLYHHALALSSTPRTEIVNFRSCSKQIAGGRTCNRLVPMHLQCGKSTLSPQLVTRLGSNDKHKQVVHGLSIPLGKLGYYLPRTISRSLTEDTDTGGATSPRSRLDRFGLRLPTFSTSRHQSQNRDQRNSSELDSRGSSRVRPVRAVWRIGGTVIPAESLPAPQDQQIQSPPERPGPPVALRDQPRGEGGAIGPHMPGQETDRAPTPPLPTPPPAPGLTSRTIRFHDESS